MGAVTKMDGTPLDQRPLPNNLEAEQALIGALLLKNDHYAKVSFEVTAGDFYEPLHREAWALMVELIEANKLASPITLKPFMEGIVIGDVPVSAYLARLCAECPVDPAAVIGYAKLIADLSVRRRAFIAMEEAMARILKNHAEDTGAKLIDDLEATIEEIRPARAGHTGFVSFDRAASKAVDTAARAYQRGAVLAGLSTGLRVLDDALGGLAQTDLIIIAGRPAMGKSAIATNIAYAVARDLLARAETGETRPGVVGVISLEMSDDQVASRIIAERSRISGWRLRKGKVSEEEFAAFTAAADELRRLPIETDATPNLSLSQIAVRARNLAKRKGLALLIIDYLQLIEGGGRKAENRTRELAEITAGLKGLAKELNIPVVALAQVGRQVEQRENKRPQISDLRESGSIEQDADVILLLYRDEYYLKQQEPKPGTEAHNDWTLAMERAHGRAEVIIGKNRHGPTMTLPVGFDATLTQFKDELPEDDLRLPARLGEPSKRERQKKLTLIKEATEAFGILKNLMITASIENDGHVDKAPKGTKLVSYTLWREKCAEVLLDSDRGEKAAAALMEKVVKDLRAPASGHPPLIGRGGSKDAPFVWATEKN